MVLAMNETIVSTPSMEMNSEQMQQLPKHNFNKCCQQSVNSYPQHTSEPEV